MKTHAVAEPETIVSVLSGLLQAKGLVFVSVPRTLSSGPQTRRGNWGALGFRVYNGIGGSTKGLIRSVTLANDADGWDFRTQGEIQAFEDVDRYKQEKKADRLTIDLLENYARSHNIAWLGENLYSGTAVSVFAD